MQASTRAIGRPKRQRVAAASAARRGVVDRTQAVQPGPGHRDVSDAWRGLAADELLHQKGLFVIPDILANAGGVTVSYFEWVQDRMGYFWREDVVNERLQDKMVASFNDLCRYADQHSVDTRTAAYMLAIDRVAYDTRMRGIYA